MELPVTRVVAPESLFERCSWFYALCREYLFRDHTAEICEGLRLTGTVGEPGGIRPGMHVVELGCGPGFYSCKIAESFPAVCTTGIDLSERLLSRGRRRAMRRGLGNCVFLQGDAHALPEIGRVDAVVVSRLFLIVVRRRDVVLGEIYRVLDEGGRCFIAEPTSGFRTRIPLAVMWLLSKWSSTPAGDYREPRQAEVMRHAEFRGLIESQPWGSVSYHNDGWYQYAVCEKGRG